MFIEIPKDYCNGLSCRIQVHSKPMDIVL